jgi:AraC-like DNA-binding protein
LDTIKAQTIKNEINILPQPALVPGGVLFLPYRSSIPVMQGMASLQTHMISLISAGEKIIHVGNVVVPVASGQILLLAGGNYLFTERIPDGNELRSTIIYFDDELVAAAIGQQNTIGAALSPFVVFKQDDYLRHFTMSVDILLQSGDFSALMQRAKLLELLVFLYTRYPELLSGWQRKEVIQDAILLRTIVESDSSLTLTLNELAFLCHMSLATFKRKFRFIYHDSPAAWLQSRRLELAASKLQTGKARPGDVYLGSGYDNHSSFSKAFKQYFGVLPKDYGK